MSDRKSVQRPATSEDIAAGEKLWESSQSRRRLGVRAFWAGFIIVGVCLTVLATQARGKSPGQKPDTTAIVVFFSGIGAVFCGALASLAAWFAKSRLTKLTKRVQILLAPVTPLEILDRYGRLIVMQADEGGLHLGRREGRRMVLIWKALATMAGALLIVGAVGLVVAWSTGMIPFQAKGIKVVGGALFGGIVALGWGLSRSPIQLVARGEDDDGGPALIVQYAGLLRRNTVWEVAAQDIAGFAYAGEDLRVHTKDGTDLLLTKIGRGDLSPWHALRLASGIIRAFGGTRLSTFKCDGQTPPMVPLPAPLAQQA